MTLVEGVSLEEREARALEKERQETRAEVRSADASLRKRERGTFAKGTKAERRTEDDDAVRANLPGELLAAFEKVRGRIKGSRLMSRTEAFLEWVHDHQGEAARYQREAEEQGAEDEWAAHMAEEKQLAKELRKRKPKT